MIGKRKPGTIYVLGTLLAGTTGLGVIACRKCEDTVRQQRRLHSGKSLRWDADEPILTGDVMHEETCRVCGQNLEEVAGVRSN